MPGWLPGGVSSTVLGDWIYFEFKFQPISNQFQIVSNFGWPKKDLPELKKFKKNMVVNVLKKETMFSIGTSLDSKWILNKKLGNQGLFLTFGN
jgi:hypothetical protein